MIQIPRLAGILALAVVATACIGGSEASPLLSDPQGVAVDRQGNVYVANYSGHVLKLSPSGQVLADWEMHDSHGLRHPLSVAVDAKADIYVSDARQTTVCAEYCSDEDDDGRVVKLSPTE